MENFLLTLLKLLRADAADIATADGLQKISDDTQSELNAQKEIILELRNFIKEFAMVLSVETAKLSAAMDTMNVKLDAATARDAVQVQALVDTRAELESLKAVVTALPVDTTDAEAQIDAVIAKMDAADAKLDALSGGVAPDAPVELPVPAVPVVTDPAPAVPVEVPAPEAPVEVPAVPVVADPAAPVVTDPAPVAVDPAAPVVTDPAAPGVPVVDPAAPVITSNS